MKNLILILLSIAISGCAAAAIGSYAYKSSKSKEAKQQFMANYHQINIEREKQGLQPLDLCTEQYHFDEDWANDDPNCAKRIADYEAGITDALGTSKMPATEESKSATKPEESKSDPEPITNNN